jgi:hypothetical protein
MATENVVNSRGFRKATGTARTTLRPAPAVLPLETDHEMSHSHFWARKNLQNPWKSAVSDRFPCKTTHRFC